MSAGFIGGLVTGIAAGLMEAASRKEREHGDSPRSGQPVWRNSDTEGSSRIVFGDPSGSDDRAARGAAPNACWALC